MLKRNTIYSGTMALTKKLLYIYINASGVGRANHFSYI